MGRAKKTTSIDRCEITFIGGSYDKKKLCFKYPTPRFLVMNMGRDIYERSSPKSAVDAEYAYTEDPTEYKAHVEARKSNPLIDD